MFVGSGGTKIGQHGSSHNDYGAGGHLKNMENDFSTGAKGAAIARRKKMQSVGGGGGLFTDVASNMKQ